MSFNACEIFVEGAWGLFIAAVSVSTVLLSSSLSRIPMVQDGPAGARYSGDARSSSSATVLPFRGGLLSDEAAYPIG